MRNPHSNSNPSVSFRTPTGASPLVNVITHGVPHTQGSTKTTTDEWNRVAAFAAAVLVEQLRVGQPVRFTALGSSMWPSIRSGALVEVVPCAASELRPGDIAAFERDDRIVIHRVVARCPHGLRFRGDALDRDDGEVPDAKVLGRVRLLSQPRLHVRIPRSQDLLRAGRWISTRIRAWLASASDVMRAGHV